MMFMENNGKFPWPPRPVKMKTWSNYRQELVFNKLFIFKIQLLFHFRRNVTLFFARYLFCSFRDFCIKTFFFLILVNRSFYRTKKFGKQIISETKRIVNAKIFRIVFFVTSRISLIIRKISVDRNDNKFDFISSSSSSFLITLRSLIYKRCRLCYALFLHRKKNSQKEYTSDIRLLILELITSFRSKK